MQNMPRILPLVGVAIAGVIGINALSGAQTLPDLVSGARAFAEEAAKGVKSAAAPAVTEGLAIRRTRTRSMRSPEVARISRSRSRWSAVRPKGSLMVRRFSVPAGRRCSRSDAMPHQIIPKQ